MTSGSRGHTQVDMPDPLHDFLNRIVYRGGCSICERPFEEEGLSRKAGHVELPGRPRRLFFCRVCWDTLREGALLPPGERAAEPDPAAAKAARLLGPRARPGVAPDNPACPLCELPFDGWRASIGLRVILANWGVRVAVCRACVEHIRGHGEGI